VTSNITGAEQDDDACQQALFRYEAGHGRTAGEDPRAPYIVNDNEKERRSVRRRTIAGFGFG
jgi:hypothetical protein